MLRQRSHITTTETTGIYSDAYKGILFLVHPKYEVMAYIISVIVSFCHPERSRRIYSPLNTQREKSVHEEKRSFDFAQDDRMIVLSLDDRMIALSLQMSDEPFFYLPPPPSGTPPPGRRRITMRHDSFNTMRSVCYRPYRTHVK